jgi:hypothetical protein
MSRQSKIYLFLQQGLLPLIPQARNLKHEGEKTKDSAELRPNRGHNPDRKLKSGRGLYPYQEPCPLERGGEREGGVKRAGSSGRLDVAGAALMAGSASREVEGREKKRNGWGRQPKQ